MKSVTPILRVALLLLAIAGGYYLIHSSYNTEISEAPTGEARESAETIPGPWLFHQRAYPHGRVERTAVLEARRARKQLLREKLQTASQRLDNEWEFAGATNIGGRVTDLEMPPSDLQTIYVGTASGGIFKTENQGADWTPIFDDALSLAIGDIALAPSDENILYVGTGEPNGGGGSITYDGLGVYKSTDAGATWKALGLETVGSIGKIVVDPTDPDRVWVAAMGDLFGQNQNRGVYYSENGGQSWERVLFVSEKSGAIDLAIHPQNPDVLYAAMWERTRTPDNNVYGGDDSGIYRSTDGGRTWTELTNGLPFLAEQKGRIGLAIAPSQAETVYAYYATTDGWTQGVFRTDDGGDNWTNANAFGINSVPFMWWFGKIFVHPQIPDRLYLSGFHTERSDDGGSLWSTVFAGAHVDQHSVFIHPLNPNLVVIGNDGGVYLSFDGGDTYGKLNGLPITQFYTCEIDPQNPAALYGGTQDNGSQRTPDGQLDNWELLLWGDGFVCLVNPVDPNIQYAESQYGNLYKSVDGGQSFFRALLGVDGADRNNWNSPVVFDPADPEVMYFGTQRLYRSTDGGDRWTPISEDLSKGPGGGSQVYGTLTSISVSPLDPNLIYVGTDDGNVWRTDDQGGQWTLLSDALPLRWVTSVRADPKDAEVAYVTFSGYRYNLTTPHVFKTEDRGATWRSISGDLPDVPVNKLLILEDDRLVIATDIGVFLSEDGGAEWELLGTALPNVVVTDLDYYAPTTTLVAATYGRSMYRYTFAPTTSTTAPATPDWTARVFPNPSRGQAQLRWEAPEPGRYTVDLFDASGKWLRRLGDQDWAAGTQQLTLDPTGLTAGLYRLSLSNGVARTSLEWVVLD